MTKFLFGIRRFCGNRKQERKDSENDILDVSHGAPPVGRLVFDDSKLP